MCRRLVPRSHGLGPIVAKHLVATMKLLRLPASQRPRISSVIPTVCGVPSKGYQSALDRFPGLLQHLGHVAHVEVRDVGAEECLQSCAGALVVEGPGERWIVRFAAKVEILRELTLDFVGCLSVRGGKFVPVLTAF